MNFKVWFKSKAADRILSPLRNELIGLIEQDATLFEVGCGTGDLLFKSASKIRYGYGVDVDKGMIEYAELKKRERNLNHLKFECIDALKMDPQKFDISTSTLCLHALPERKACDLLRRMIDSSKIVLIADYSKAGSALSGMLIELDELFSGHYHNYRRYRKSGEIPGYVKKIDAIIQQETASVIEGISIWRICKGR